MKRLFLMLALVAVLLCGCAEDTPDTTASTAGDPTQQVAEVTEAPGLYDPETELEALTGGAVRGYPLPDSDCSGVVPMDGDLLMFSGEEVTTLTVLTGENLSTACSVTLDCFLDPEDPCVQVTENGLGYYDSGSRAVVFLDRDLHEIGRTSLPEDMDDTPVLSPDFATVYYCAGSQIRALDLQEGISRLVKEQSCTSQDLTGIFCNGKVLRCLSIDAEDHGTDMFLSAQTGQTLYSGSVEQFQTFGDSYFVEMDYGSVRELFFSLDGGQEMTLEPLDYDAITSPVLPCGGVVTASLIGGIYTLDYYDLASGRRTASLELPGVDTVINFVADPQRNVLWFLYDGAQSSGQVLYCWDPAESPVSDETVYTGKHYTAENPDLEGLAFCQKEAQRLGEKYGVEILLWQDVLSIQPGDYTYESEYLVSVYQRGLQRLESALARFPEGFLKETAIQSDCGVLRIALVRSILGGEAHGTFDSVEGLQYWYGGDACIGLTLDDSLEQLFYHELFHVIETRVYASTTAYDDWDKLNPKGFSYDYDYLTNQNRADYQYLEGNDRAFIDLYSMSYPKEDRARVFEYAMIDAGAGCFASKTLQSKLNKLCVGIRKAYGLKDYPEILPWEQYLEEPLIP